MLIYYSSRQNIGSLNGFRDMVIDNQNVCLF